jgi:L-seryl-tRNA(Ser) seleniumtransferase
VDRLLRTVAAESLIERWGRPAVVEAIRGSIAVARSGEEGESGSDAEDLLDRARSLLVEWARPALLGVLNGSGVVLHTNLGRAPLASEALEAVSRVARGYSNLEYDLDGGGRGDRYVHCVDLITALTGSEDALVVNNNAAAVALVVNELAGGRDVVVSRGELVEIGGSFRIPDIVTRAGGYLVEVGTTNRTRLEDYRRVLTPSTGMLLKVHPSNYRLMGFTEEVCLSDLVTLARDAGVPVVHDLGSGQLLPGIAAGLPDDPGPRESVELGAHIVTWSGDKLLGGPQAGIIHGSAELVGRLRSNPLLRALRVDKMTLAALEATLRLYRDPERVAEHLPALRMLSEGAGDVLERAEAARKHLPPAHCDLVEVGRMISVVGGGAMPGAEIPSGGWRVSRVSPHRLDGACRESDPPLVGRIEESAFLVDFRTILPGQEEEVARAVSSALEVVSASGGDAG